MRKTGLEMNLLQETVSVRDVVDLVLGVLPVVDLGAILAAEVVLGHDGLAFEPASLSKLGLVLNIITHGRRHSVRWTTIGTAALRQGARLRNVRGSSFEASISQFNRVGDWFTRDPSRMTTAPFFSSIVYHKTGFPATDARALDRYR